MITSGEGYASSLVILFLILQWRRSYVLSVEIVFPIPTRGAFSGQQSLVPRWSMMLGIGSETQLPISREDEL